jgi:hypothetical protein
MGKILGESFEKQANISQRQENNETVHANETENVSFTQR